MDEALREFKHYRKIVDDIVIFDSNFDEHVAHVKQFLATCADKGILLHRDKVKFAEHEVTFAGYRLSQDGYHIDKSLLKAISEFPMPTNCTELRSFFGLANQISVNTEKVSKCLQPLRPLLSSKNEFVWCPHHSVAFEAAKEILSKVLTLAFYDTTRPTRIMTDACNTGLGFVLQQKNGDTWRTIQTGSRFLSDAETRYATIKKEMLGVTWSIRKCHKFLAGLPHFEVVSDHNPLLAVLNNRRLDEIENPRLQRMRTKLMSYHFTARWQKGVLNHAPDALSRSPINDPEQDDEVGEDQLQSPYKLAALSQRVELNVKLREVHDVSNSDNKYQ